MVIKKTTVNPLISPRGLIANLHLWTGGLLEGGLIRGGGLIANFEILGKTKLKNYSKKIVKLNTKAYIQRNLSIKWLAN